MATSRNTYADDSDDEIVWNLSDRREPSPALNPSYSPVSDVSSDFFIISRPLSPAFHSNPLIYSAPRNRAARCSAKVNALTEQVAKLRISSSTKGSTKREPKKPNRAVLQNGTNQPAPKNEKNNAKKKVQQKPVPVDVYPLPSPKAEKTSAKAKKKRFSNDTKPTRRNLIGNNNTDVRPVVSTGSQGAKAPSLYEEASTFISRFLSNPDARNDSVCRLTLLQSLIIELGLATSTLPASLTGARAFLKARAFLNVREYIAVRSQGPDAIQRAMYPSRSALIKNFRRNRGDKAPLQWVKDMGLQVLLVDWMH